jgi:hypothetical protein
MGTDAACSLLFCVATFRLGQGLVCHVSAVSRGRSLGNCFPQLGSGSMSSRAKRYQPFSLVPNPDGVVVCKI